jgi:hypothetical protein
MGCIPDLLRNHGQNKTHGEVTGSGKSLLLLGN